MLNETNFLVPTSYYVILSALLFTLGVIGVLVRRNAILVFMSIELMLNSANLAFVAFARALTDLAGQVSVFFVITVAAAEVAIGLALIVAIFRTKHSIDIDELHEMRG
ncbi:MAG TPA: NADH-quinone oxidoreductase subunit NuoK [Aggregatilineales bacterium]|nr:NADH-quinone oxidoreductase subunit NuoK [Aggregatilineales bacterium]